MAANASRPATAILHDSADVRLVVFRIAPGQVVAPHRNGATVALTVISGRGLVQGEGGEQAVAQVETIVFEPNEQHGMRAEDSELVLLAAITPRPGTRRREDPETHAIARAATGNRAGAGS
jgi:quercetin dioxygenase-like cupin family protein